MSPQRRSLRRLGSLGCLERQSSVPLGLGRPAPARAGRTAVSSLSHRFGFWTDPQL